MKFRFVGDICEAFSIVIEASCEQEAIDILSQMSAREIRKNAESIGSSELNPDSITVADTLDG